LLHFFFVFSLYLLFDHLFKVITPPFHHLFWVAGHNKPSNKTFFD
jgi:hypothetical protein